MDMKLVFVHVLVVVNLSSSTGKTITGTIYADNCFDLYVNGKLVAKDTTCFKPHQAVKVSFEGAADGSTNVYAIKAVDFADPVTGLEHQNTRVGDGGLIARFSDDVVTNSSWKCYTTSYGPINHKTCLQGTAPFTSCRVANYDMPKNWYVVDFNDTAWPNAKEFTSDEVRWGKQPRPWEGVAPKFVDWGNASFIWRDSLLYDNTILCRYGTKSKTEGLVG